MLHAPRRIFLTMILATGILSLGGCMGSGNNAATTPQQLNRDADHSLKMLTSINPSAAAISRKAKAVLIFPNIVKAGVVFGGAYGEGVLKEGGEVKGYYNLINASWGLQLGAQSYSYAMFLMSDRAVRYLYKSQGWEFGTGPTVVLLNEGAAKKLDTTTLRDDVYAFVFDQQGLMGSLSLEGTKITRISNP